MDGFHILADRDVTVELAQRFGEEVLHRVTRVGGVSITIDLKSSIHMCLSEVSVGCFINWQVFHSLLKSCVFRIKNDDILRENLSIDGVAWEGLIGVLALLILIFGDLLKEDALSILLGPWISIEDEALILAGSRVHLKAHDPVENFVWEADLHCGPVKFWILFLVSCLFILCHSNILEFFNFGADLFSQRILEFHRCVYEVSNFDMRNTIRLREL